MIVERRRAPHRPRPGSAPSHPRSHRAPHLQRFDESATGAVIVSTPSGRGSTPRGPAATASPTATSGALPMRRRTHAEVAQGTERNPDGRPDAPRRRRRPVPLRAVLTRRPDHRHDLGHRTRRRGGQAPRQGAQRQCHHPHRRVLPRRPRPLLGRALRVVATRPRRPRRRRRDAGRDPDHHRRRHLWHGLRRPGLGHRPQRPPVQRRRNPR